MEEAFAKCEDLVDEVLAAEPGTGNEQAAQTGDGRHRQSSHRCAAVRAPLCGVFSYRAARCAGDLSMTVSAGAVLRRELCGTRGS